MAYACMMKTHLVRDPCNSTGLKSPSSGVIGKVDVSLSGDVGMGSNCSNGMLSSSSMGITIEDAADSAMLTGGGGG